MNLWARKIGLILLSALTFFSCEEELSTVGLPPENNLGIFFVEIPLGDKVTQVWIDSTGSINTGSLLVGVYHDDYFGKIEAANFSDLKLPSPKAGKDLEGDNEFELDSLVFEARIADIYGENVASSTQLISLHQLADEISLINIVGEDTTAAGYYTFSSQPLGQKLAEMEFDLHPDSLDVEFKDTGRDTDMDAADSAYRDKFFDKDGRYIYKTSFRIDDGFSQNFWSEISSQSAQFETDSAFREYFKGIALTASPMNSAVITYSASQTQLVLYYTETDDDGNKEQKQLKFPLSFRSYNNIKPNKNQGWSGSDFDGLSAFNEPFTPSTDLAYLQSGTNLLLKLDLSGLQQFNDTLSNPIVQKAELVIKNLKSASGTTPPPSYLTYYMTSTEELSKGNYGLDKIRDNTGQPLATSYNSKDNEYRSNLTLFLPNFFEEEKYNQVIVAPAAITKNGPVFESGRSVNRLAVSKDDIVLRLYYTLPDRNK